MRRREWATLEQCESNSHCDVTLILKIRRVNTYMTYRCVEDCVCVCVYGVGGVFSNLIRIYQGSILYSAWQFDRMWQKQLQLCVDWAALCCVAFLVVGWQRGEEGRAGRLGAEWDRMSLCSTQCPKAIKAKRNGKPLCIADVVVVVGISMKLRPMSNVDVGDEAKNE